MVILEGDMKTIGAGVFKAKCLGILDEVAENGEPVSVTKRGKVVGVLIPPSGKETDASASLKGSVIFEQDIDEPLEDIWEASE